MNFWKALNNEIARFFVETGDFCLLCNIVTGFCNIATLHCNIATSEILRTFFCPYLCAKFCRGTKYSKILELYCDYMRLEFYYIYLSIITSLRIQEKELQHKFKHYNINLNNEKKVNYTKSHA